MSQPKATAQALPKVPKVTKVTALRWALSGVLVLAAAGALVLGFARARLLSVEGVMGYVERFQAADAMRDVAAAVVVERALRQANRLPDPPDLPPSPEVEALRRTAQAELQDLFAGLFPRATIEARLRQLLAVSWPFFEGDVGGFALRLDVIPDGARARAALSDALPESALFEALYAQALDRAAARALAARTTWPFGWEVSHADVVDMLRDLLPRPWVAARVADAVGQWVALMREAHGSLTLLLPVHERDDTIALRVRALALGSDTYRFLIDHFIRPAARQALAGERQWLPWGLSLGEEDVVSALVEALPEDWFTLQKLNIAEALAAYLLGDRPSLRIEVPVGQRKAAAAAVLSGMIVRKLHAQMPTLPVCASVDTFRAQFDTMDAPLRCRLRGGLGGGALLMLDLHISSRISQRLEAQLPNRWAYTDADLARHLSPDAWARVQDMRAALVGGVVITSDDLRAHLSPWQRRAFDSALSLARDGLHLSSGQLEAACADGSPCQWQRLRAALIALQVGLAACAGAGALSLLGLLALSMWRAKPAAPDAVARRWAPRMLGALSLCVLLGTRWLDLTLDATFARLSAAWPWPPAPPPKLPLMLATMRAETVNPLYALAAALLTAALLSAAWAAWRARSASPKPR